MGGPNISDASAQNEVLTFTFPASSSCPLAFTLTVEGAAIKGPSLTGILLPTECIQFNDLLKQNFMANKPKKNKKKQYG